MNKRKKIYHYNIPDKEPFSKNQIIKIFSDPSGNPVKIYNKHFKNPDPTLVDEYLLDGDNIKLYYKGNETDIINFEELLFCFLEHSKYFKIVNN